MQLLMILVNQMGIKDVLDIILVAVLVYQMLRMVHGTRALQVLIGMALLLVVLWIGVIYKLYALKWLLAHFFDSFFVVFIILFQDQIKSALASVGTGKKFFGMFNRGRGAVDVDEMVEAMMTLQKEGIGALVVYERTQGLANYVATGTKLNSEIHSDLIYSIFQSKSPLHDGAIIIQKGKLAGAGCFLPLSKNIDLDRHFGTRHRAGLGLSELTDAVIITLSEETKGLGICLMGKFYAIKDENTLRNYLQHLMGNEKLEFLTESFLEGRAR